jgi:hypothetical protein
MQLSVATACRQRIGAERRRSTAGRADPLPVRADLLIQIG